MVVGDMDNCHERVVLEQVFCSRVNRPFLVPIIPIFDKRVGVPEVVKHVRAALLVGSSKRENLNVRLDEVAVHPSSWF